MTSIPVQPPKAASVNGLGCGPPFMPPTFSVASIGILNPPTSTLKAIFPVHLMFTLLIVCCSKICLHKNKILTEFKVEELSGIS